MLTPLLFSYILEFSKLIKPEIVVINKTNIKKTLLNNFLKISSSNLTIRKNSINGISLYLLTSKLWNHSKKINFSKLKPEGQDPNLKEGRDLLNQNIIMTLIKNQKDQVIIFLKTIKI